jgi:hypothetical protein
MPKFEIALTFYRTVEAANVEEAADIADYEKSRLTDNGLAGDLGWEEAVTTVKRKREKKTEGDN